MAIVHHLPVPSASTALSRERAVARLLCAGFLPEDARTIASALGWPASALEAAMADALAAATLEASRR